MRPLTYIEALKVLTPREIEVMELAGIRYSADEIAAELTLAVNTVYKHKENIRKQTKPDREWPPCNFKLVYGTNQALRPA